MNRNIEFGAEKGLLQGHARRLVPCASQTLNSLKGFSKALLKAKRWSGMLATVHIHQVISVSLEDQRFLQLFISVWIRRYYTLKGQRSLENLLSCVFQIIGNVFLFLQKCGASMTKHRKQSTKVNKVYKRNSSNMESDLFFPCYKGSLERFGVCMCVNVWNLV